MSLLAAARRRVGGGLINTSGPPYALPTSAPYNVPVKAEIPTYDDSGQAVHPSVIDFRQVNGGTWRGWRYWMAHTPYTDTDNQTENPQIVVSQDGYHWYNPAGIRKPLYFPPVGGFLSDVDLDYDPDTDELVLLYRVYDGWLHTPHIIRSSTGAAWPLVSSGINFTRSEQILSPCLVRVGTNDWHMYGLTRDTRVFQRWTSSDLATWSGPTNLTGLSGVVSPWHLDVLLFDGVYYMTINRGPRYLTSENGLLAATSTDGLSWNAAGSDFMNKNASYDWESAQLYRACIQPHEDGTHFRMWYSAEGSSNRWWTGYTQVRRDAWPTPPA